MPETDLGRTAYEARFADEPMRHFYPWDRLSPQRKAIWARVEAACREGMLRRATDAEVADPFNAIINERDAALLEVSAQAQARGEEEGRILFLKALGDTEEPSHEGP